MLHAFVQRFDVIENFEKIWVFGRSLIPCSVGCGTVASYMAGEW